MGKLLKIKSATTFLEVILIVVGLSGVLFGVYYLAPGLRVSESKQLTSLDLNTEDINNITKGVELPVASETPSTKVVSKPLIRIAEYAWNGNSGMLAANGGPRTTEGSLMEASSINLEVVRQDMVGELREMLVKFVEEFDGGNSYPKSEKSAFGVSIMGDGVPFFLSTTQVALDQKFGKGKYHAQVIGAIGLSYGEDKLIGPKIWKDNPKSMEGSVISSVVGDGDWIIALNYAFANGLRVNPDVTTYDKNAVNFVPSEDDDYINSVKELIKSQNSGYTIPLKEVIDGKLTGKTVNRKIDGATTWTPGDKMAFDALSGFTDVSSTKDFVNQMATTIIVIKEWALQNDKMVSNLLKATYIASNQIKQYDSWAVKASQAVAKTYNFETPEYWYNMFKGQKGTKNGLDYNIGGTKVLTYADALQYYGITDGVNRYKAVYEQVSKYLVELNPCDFNDMCKEGPVQYEDAVNLYFLKNINDIEVGKVDKVDYTANKTEVMASGQWNINFATNSAEIQGSTKDLELIYNLLIQAEDTKLSIVGHTDNTGNANSNVVLSKNRAQSVVTYLTNKGIPTSRFQMVDGKGGSEPIADNNTSAGKASNRRVSVTLLK